MSRSMLAVVGVAGMLALTTQIQAAELAVPSREPAAMAQPPKDCGPCGCLEVTYENHRDIQTTYGLGYDPRNYDTTEPHFYLGPMKAYPRYWVDGAPTPGTC